MNHPDSLAIDPRELPATNPPAIPLWAENYVYEVTCPRVTAGFFMHLARQPFNTDLWRDTFVCDLGGDEVYLWKGFGKGAHDAGPGGSQLKFICIESFKHWVIEFDGAAQRVPRKLALPGAGGAVREGPIVPLRLHLDIVADGPIWDLGKTISTHDWGKEHYQQSMRVTGGEVIVDGKSTPMEGVATRDHTRGPRDFNGLGSYAWVHGGLPGGRHFITMQLDPRAGRSDQPPIRTAVICDGDNIIDVEILETTAIPTSRSGPPDNFVIRLKGPKGTETIEGERMTKGVIVGVGAPNHLMLGPSENSITRAHLCGTPTRFRWNGETCYGYSEQTIAV